MGVHLHARYTDAEALAAAIAGGLGADYPMKLKPNLTRWVLPGWHAQAETTVVAIAGLIYYIPIFVEETTTYIRLGCVVNAGAAGTAGLRIYTWNNGLPDALILDAGNVDTTAAGDKEIVIDQELTRGYYFCAIRCTATPRIQTPAVQFTTKIPISGQYTAQEAHVTDVILTVDAAYADPAPAPTAMVGINYGLFVQLREN